MNVNLREIIQFVHRVGMENNQEVYLVGGFVRDLKRKQSSEDLDFVIVGTPSVFADQLMAASCSSNEFKMEKVKEYPQFGTMTLCITSNDGFSLKIDLATSRTEHYTKPAELPIVQPANSINADIERRGTNYSFTTI